MRGSSGWIRRGASCSTASGRSRGKGKKGRGIRELLLMGCLLENVLGC